MDAMLTARMLIATLALAPHCVHAETVTVGGAADDYEQGYTKEAIRDLGQLAEAGDTRAQYYYGVELIKGVSVAQDLVRGYAWVETAADCAATCSSSEVSAQSSPEIRLHKMVTT